MRIKKEEGEYDDGAAIIQKTDMEAEDWIRHI